MLQWVVMPSQIPTLVVRLTMSTAPQTTVGSIQWGVRSVRPLEPLWDVRADARVTVTPLPLVAVCVAEPPILLAPADEFVDLLDREDSPTAIHAVGRSRDTR